VYGGWTFYQVATERVNEYNERVAKIEYFSHINVIELQSKYKEATAIYSNFVDQIPYVGTQEKVERQLIQIIDKFFNETGKQFDSVQFAFAKDKVSIKFGKITSFKNMDEALNWIQKLESSYLKPTIRNYVVTIDGKQGVNSKTKQTSGGAQTWSITGLVIEIPFFGNGD
jgi:hypothetical protein